MPLLYLMNIGDLKNNDLAEKYLFLCLKTQLRKKNLDKILKRKAIFSNSTKWISSERLG